MYAQLNTLKKIRIMYAITIAVSTTCTQFGMLALSLGLSHTRTHAHTLLALSLKPPYRPHASLGTDDSAPTHTSDQHQPYSYCKHMGARTMPYAGPQLTATHSFQRSRFCAYKFRQDPARCALACRAVLRTLNTPLT